MFKIPDWGDTPNSNISFTKNLPHHIKKKNKKSKTPEHPKQVLQIKPNFKAKAKTKFKLKLNKRWQHENKNEKLHENNAISTQNYEKHNFKNQEISSSNLGSYKKNLDNGNKIKNYNDLKKKKLNTYRNDKEVILSHESPKRVNIKNNKNKKKTTEAPRSIATSDISTKSFEKSKQHTNLPEVDKEPTLCNNNSNATSLDNGIEKKIDFRILHKKKALQAMLQKNQETCRNQVKVNTNKLRERMLDRLKAAKFRYLNEKLYTSSGSDAQQLFQADPTAFQTYHEGYQQQVQKWPVKPLDVIVKRIQKMPKSYIIADMGCGQAELARRVAQSVRSFDLVPGAPGVEACDMARTPLAAGEVDAAVYCLALMGTQLTQYLLEANRVLRMGGHLLIAEVESRFDSIERFTSDVQRLGFSLKKMDDSHRVFYFLEFTKVRDPPAKKGKLPTLTLKPCIYKKR